MCSPYTEAKSSAAAWVGFQHDPLLCLPPSFSPSPGCLYSFIGYMQSLLHITAYDEKNPCHYQFNVKYWSKKKKIKNKSIPKTLSNFNQNTVHVYETTSTVLVQFDHLMSESNKTTSQRETIYPKVHNHMFLMVPLREESWIARMVSVKWNTFVAVWISCVSLTAVFHNVLVNWSFTGWGWISTVWNSFRGEFR